MTDKIKTITTKYIQSQKELDEKNIIIHDLMEELTALKQEHINYNKVSMIRQQDKLVQSLQTENVHLKKQLALYKTPTPPLDALSVPPEIKISVKRPTGSKLKKKPQQPLTPPSQESIIPIDQLPLSQMELIKCNGTQYWEYNNNLYEFIDYETVGQFVRKYI